MWSGWKKLSANSGAFWKAGSVGCAVLPTTRSTMFVDYLAYRRGNLISSGFLLFLKNVRCILSLNGWFESTFSRFDTGDRDSSRSGFSLTT